MLHECVSVSFETPAWVYDRTVWLCFIMLLRECENTQIHTPQTQASCLCLWRLLGRAPGIKLLSAWMRPLSRFTVMTQSGLSPDEKSSFISSQAVRRIHHHRHRHHDHKVLSSLCFNQPRLPGGDSVWQMLRFLHEPKTHSSKHIERRNYNGGDNTPVMLLSERLACSPTLSEFGQPHSKKTLLYLVPTYSHQTPERCHHATLQCVPDSEVVFCI